MKHLVIVGGGIAGLSTAWYVQQQAHAQGIDLAITLIEKDERLGGKITTDDPQGYVIEGGPDSFITQKPWALQLCRELSLEDQLIGTNDERRNIYILRRGKLRKMPDGLMLVVPTRFLPIAVSPLISPVGKLRMSLDLLIPPRQMDKDESLGDFMRRRLGQEALEVLGEPMMAGIHVADADALSMQATFPRFIELERKHGSLIRGMLATRKNRPPSSQSLFMTMKGGLRGLVEALQEKIDADIITGVSVTSVDGGRVETKDGRDLPADAIVLATPAYVTADILADMNAELSDLLRSIRYVSTATVSLGFHAQEIKHPLNGFGFIIPRSEPTRLLACTWTSTKFDFRAPPGDVLLRAFIGGPHHPEIVRLDDDELIDITRAELATIMGISAAPTVSRVFRWLGANPQYDVGHLNRVAQIETLLPDGVYVTGSAYRGLGIPDCIHQGQQTAEKVLQHLHTSEKLQQALTV